MFFREIVIELCTHRLGLTHMNLLSQWSGVCLFSVFTKEKERCLTVCLSVFRKLEKQSTSAFQLPPKTLLFEP